MSKQVIPIDVRYSEAVQDTWGLGCYFLGLGLKPRLYNSRFEHWINGGRLIQTRFGVAYVSVDEDSSAIGVEILALGQTKNLIHEAVSVDRLGTVYAMYLTEPARHKGELYFSNVGLFAINQNTGVIDDSFLRMTLFVKGEQPPTITLENVIGEPTLLLEEPEPITPITDLTGRRKNVSLLDLKNRRLIQFAGVRPERTMRLELNIRNLAQQLSF